jgi:hypothetical protein
MAKRRTHRTHHHRRRRRNPAAGTVRVLAGRGGLLKALSGFGSRAARVVVVR